MSVYLPIRDAQEELKARAEIWRGFVSTRHYPNPSVISGNELDDLLAVVVASKPAADLLIVDFKLEGGSHGRSFSQRDVLDHAEQNKLMYHSFGIQSGCEKFFVFRDNKDFNKYSYAFSILNRLKINDPANIALAIEQQRYMLEVLGHDRLAIEDSLAQKRDRLIKTVRTERIDDSLSTPPSDPDGMALRWSNRFKNKQSGNDKKNR